MNTKPSLSADQPWTAIAEDWAIIQEPQHRPLWMAMLQAANVGKGMKVLDAGCGAGGGCFLAAHYGAEAYGFDGSADLVRLARQRLPQGHFEVSDLTSPPFAGVSFRVITAANSLQFSAEPLSALRVWKERLLPGQGSIVFGLWCPQDESEQIHIMRAIRGVLPNDPPGRSPFSLSERGMLESLLEQAGLIVKDARDVDITFEYPDMEQCWRGLRSAGSMQYAIQTGGEELVKKTFIETAKQFLMTDGSVFIHNKMRYVLGQNFQ
ncbi:MAG TPA: methyltransferase domain-containing protein [Terriglobales bacterium]|nr:methyltransferase domain-containing protein [Terriglobales bacterium]